MTATEIPVDNGFNVQALLGVRGALAGTRQISQFQWRSTVSWVNGTYSRSDVETCYGFGAEQGHHRRFSYDIDHPLQFAAQDNGVTAVEYVLVALGGGRTPPKERVMNHHPVATTSAAAIAGRDSTQLAAAVTDTVRLRSLLPGGPIEQHGRDAVVARVGGWFADMDTVDLVESAGQAVADRLLIHYWLHLARRGTRRACTQTSICTIDDGRLAKRTVEKP